MSRAARKAAYQASTSSKDVPSSVTTELVMRAEWEYAASGRRLDLLGGTLTSEPAWNMLLDLFVSGARKRILSVSALTIGSRVAPATALRYLKLLVEADLVERQFDELDGRRVHVRLTSAGWQTVVGLLDMRIDE